MCVCGKEAKQVIKFIQLFCSSSYFNITVYTILNFFLEISFEHYFDQLFLWCITLHDFFKLV